MAVLAFQSEVASVNLRFSVAIQALTGGILKAPIRVTILTGELSMFPLQRETLFVVKTSHAVNPIVAIQAGRAKFVLVFMDEVRLLLSLFVTSAALFNFEGINVKKVACLASDHLSTVIHLMMRQAETSLGEMVERLPFQGGRGPCLCAVAHIAALSEDTRMHLGFLVAGSAGTGSLTENLENIFSVIGMLAFSFRLAVTGAA